MSSCSSDIDVQESVRSDVSVVEEKPNTIQDVLNHCQDIHTAVQNLDKKFDIINGKVSKIHRVRVKSLWQIRKPFGYAYRKHSYLISRKTRLQKIKRRELPASPSSTSRPISYSPTSPVARPPNSPIHGIGSPYRSEGSPERDRESLYQDQELSLSQSPSIQSVFTNSYYSYYSPNDGTQSCPNLPCFSSPGAQSTSSLLSAQPSTAMSAPALDQGISSPAHDPEMMTYPSLLEDKSLDHISPPSFGEPTGFTPTSPVPIDQGMLKQGPDDPSTWAIEDVILFLKQMDPQISDSVADLFREHDIDGKALLLLNSDMMIKYMGLKLGTAVKLCHYIEKLKEENIMTPEKSFM
ncbi:sex comb on midleg-like protein 1 isoform X3 [Rousettus aegyptiacus]|uniref:Scm polycomb group protein like 1 n=1 Tax=Rousettus aegyptiacus TaxID=9407 RepID=A0A7J8ELK0_ROUAE|nr:sex comb on midleg-like protein 1 isoform X3 [Rousettus aegyptiacus]KAF6436358.1 Scm polycomb group protein like 1 [Rousettus aegyptiacus]